MTAVPSPQSSGPAACRHPRPRRYRPSGDLFVVKVCARCGIELGERLPRCEGLTIAGDRCAAPAAACRRHAGHRP